MSDRRQRLAHLAGRLGVVRVLLIGHARPARCGWPASVALGDKALDTGRASGREQVVGPLGPQPVGLGEVAVKPARVERGDRGQLVDDHVRAGRSDGIGDPLAIKRVRDHGGRPEPLQQLALGGGSGHPGHVVPGADQARHQLAPDRPCRSCNEHLHRRTSHLPIDADEEIRIMVWY